MVPRMVTPSGVRPIRSAALAVGVGEPRERRPGQERHLAHRLFRPLGGQQLAGVAQQLRDHLGAADDGDEVRVAAPPRHHVHVQVLGQRPARRRPQVQADVEAVRPRHVLDDANRLLDERHQLRALGIGQVLELGHPPVGHHHQMPGVVRVEVEHGVDEFAAGDHQAFLVGQLRDVGERLVGFVVVALHRRFGQIRHPVRRPQPLQVVAFTDTPVENAVVACRPSSLTAGYFHQFSCGRGILAVGDPLHDGLDRAVPRLRR